MAPPSSSAAPLGDFQTWMQQTIQKQIEQTNEIFKAMNSLAGKAQVDELKFQVGETKQAVEQTRAKVEGVETRQDSLELTVQVLRDKVEKGQYGNSTEVGSAPRSSSNSSNSGPVAAGRAHSVAGIGQKGGPS